MSSWRDQIGASDEVFYQHPTVYADEAVGVTDLRLSVGPSNPEVNVPVHLQSPQGPSNLELTLGIPEAHQFTDHAWSTLPVGIQSTYQSGMQHMEVDYPLFPSSSLNGPGVASSSQNRRDAWNSEVISFLNNPGSGTWHFEVPPPSSATTNSHMTLLDTGLQSGPISVGPNSSTPGIFSSHFGQFHGGLDLAHAPVPFAAGMEFLELHQPMYDEPQVVTMHPQGTQFNTFQPPLIMDSLVTHEEHPLMMDSLVSHGDMGFDMDIMPFEATHVNTFQPPVVIGSLDTHADLSFDLNITPYEATHFNTLQPPFVMGPQDIHADMNFDLNMMPSEDTQFDTSHPPLIMDSVVPQEDIIYNIDSMSDEETQSDDFLSHVVMGSPVLDEDIGFDIDDMTYEDLAALGEQIGNVSNGLTEETIMELLKKRKYECVTSDQPSDSETCCICTDDYVYGVEIGALNCGHEFHAECIKNWLLIKNDCPLCKAKGLGD